MSLGEVGDIKAIKPLSNLMADDDWDVRKEVEKALNQIDSDWMSFL